jgi:hypothetical protein
VKLVDRLGEGIDQGNPWRVEHGLFVGWPTRPSWELQRVVSRPSPGRWGPHRGRSEEAELQMHGMGGGATGGTDSNPKAW